ncbi:hypothetical protein U1Q18_023470 [Sarracenia purpurea var. burkii]
MRSREGEREYVRSIYRNASNPAAVLNGISTLLTLSLIYECGVGDTLNRSGSGTRRGSYGADMWRSWSLEMVERVGLTDAIVLLS